MLTFAEAIGGGANRDMRLHDDCHREVQADDPREPCWFCPTCQTTVRTEDTTLFPARHSHVAWKEKN